MPNKFGQVLKYGTPDYIVHWITNDISMYTNAVWFNPGEQKEYIDENLWFVNLDNHPEVTEGTKYNVDTGQFGDS